MIKEVKTGYLSPLDLRSRVSVGKALVTNINGKALIRVFDTNEKEIKITISTIELEELEIAILYKS